MRLIGHVPSQPTAVVFSHYLRLQGITNELEQERDGWAIWVHSEDELDKARGLFVRFLGDPEDPKFKLNYEDEPEELFMSPAAAVTPKSGVLEEQPALAKRTFGIGPLTLALVVASTMIGILSKFGENTALLSPLFICPFVVKGALIQWRTGLTEILSGEFWRLFTPALIHYGFLHLMLNLFWLIYLGSIVEARERTARLAGLVLLTAGISSLGEYFLSGPGFGGMSGVLYGLLGYIWMKCRFQPGSGYHLDLGTLTFMLIWFFVCLAGIIPNVANGAHAMGLLTGLAWGFLSAKRQAWKAARA